jgi:hypothetical protein
MSVRWTGGAAMLCVLVAASGTARADAGSESVAVNEARRHMETGQELYGQGRYAEAAQEFLAANESHTSSAFVFNVGLCYMQAGDAANAARYLRQYLEMEPGTPDRTAIEDRLREIDATLAAQPVQPEGVPPPVVVITRETADESRRRMKAMLNVQTVPEGARVVVETADGTVVAEGSAPMTRAVSAGSYVLRIEHPDFETERTEVQIRAAGVYGYFYRLGQGEFLGFLRIVADQPGALVFVDSEEEGAARVTPWQDTVPVGEHSVWVKLPGFETAHQAVQVEMGAANDVTVRLERVSFGELEVLTNVDGAGISIDGGPVVIARADPGFGSGAFGVRATVPAGPHTVTIEAEDMKEYAEEVIVGQGQRTRLLVRLNPSPSRVSAWVSFGVAAACIAAGGAFGGIALDIQDGVERDRSAGRLDNNDPRILEMGLWSIGADSAFVVGAVMTGLGFYYLFRDPLPPSEGREDDPVDFSSIDDWAPLPDAHSEPVVEVTPTTGPTGLGLGLEVRF